MEHSVSDCALESMQQFSSDMNKFKHLSFLKFARFLTGITEILVGDELEQKVRSWLSAPDPWKNHNIACKSRHPGSAAWFVHGNTFPEWKVSEARGSLLWVHGKHPLAASSSAFLETDIFA